MVYLQNHFSIYRNQHLTVYHTISYRIHLTHEPGNRDVIYYVVLMQEYTRSYLKHIHCGIYPYSTRTRENTVPKMSVFTICYAVYCASFLHEA